MSRKSSRKKPKTEDEIAKLNVYPLEPSGLVSDPIPQSKRPAKKLTETGEMRLEALYNEVQEEADRKQKLAEKKALENAEVLDEDIDELVDKPEPFDPTMIEKARAIHAEAEEVAETFGSTSALIDKLDIVQSTTGAASGTAGANAVSDGASEAAPGGAPSPAGGNPDARGEAEGSTPGQEPPDAPDVAMGAAGKPAKTAGEKDAPASGTAAPLAAGVGEEEEAPGNPGEPPAGTGTDSADLSGDAGEGGAVGQAGAAPDAEDLPSEGSSDDEVKLDKEHRPPMDPWLEDVLDERKTEPEKKADFSRYQGQFARLNKFAVVKTDTELARENALKEAKRKAEQAENAEEDDGQFPKGYRVIPPEDLKDVGEDEVSVHPRELLSSATYDDLINWGTRLARETPLFYRAFSIGDVSSVCDVGCGSGRHAVMFAEWGMKVIAIDESRAMLNRVEALAKESKEKIDQANGELRCEKGGLGGVAKVVGPERVEAIVCVGDVLPRVGSSEELRSALDDFADALLPSGILVLEFSNHMRYVRQNKRTTEPVVFDTAEGTKVFMSVTSYQSESDTVKCDMLTLTCGSDDRWHVRCERLTNLFISPDTIERELLDAGFDILETAGDFTGKPLSPTEDESIVIVARRKRHRPVSKRKRTVYP